MKHFEEMDRNHLPYSGWISNELWAFHGITYHNLTITLSSLGEKNKQTNKTTEKLGIISRPLKKKVHTILQEKMVFMVLQTLNIFINFYSGAISSLRD